ncbi:MAG TPA: pyridoxamine 5'-phosphate oxidase family protein [Propionibacteriaceae bacterium]|nr:pyridoxamine 5'-phosphate oxidase family protein [Propionibacteriaceae bacterium]
MISPSASGRPDFDDSEERHFDAMGRQQCLDLIESHHLGRIAWQAGDLPQILPISYAMHQGSVYFRTLPDGLLAELAQPTSVALEVDDLDQHTRTGWSIVLHGHSSAIRQPDELADLWASDSLVPWASGNRTLFIRIRPDRIEGRVVRRPT